MGTGDVETAERTDEVEGIEDCMEDKGSHVIEEEMMEVTDEVKHEGEDDGEHEQLLTVR